ncbi:MAG: C10 family peptidase, partial [Duncaniella sp.]|nr:C10 family peptidase [Duncaniella sp.]
MILPDDDRAPALLGYADSDSFATAGNPAFNAWLEFYNEELDYVKSLPEGNRTPAARPQREEISPLIATEWNQEWPYNIDCPKVDGHETVTGCVATAMAQGMKYYNYPERGKGEHSYWWSKGKETLTFNYDNHPFKWDLMADKYDRETPYDQRQAVAELMYACGVSVNMYYEPGGSGAATITMGVQLIDIFGYSPSMYLPGRVYYGLDEWEEMIYADLAKGQPVLYSGAGTAGGHQFICDGYRGDGYFHFNWGWGGLSNGYF